MRARLADRAHGVDPSSEQLFVRVFWMDVRERIEHDFVRDAVVLEQQQGRCARAASSIADGDALTGEVSDGFDSIPVANEDPEGLEGDAAQRDDTREPRRIPQLPVDAGLDESRRGTVVELPAGQATLASRP